MDDVDELRMRRDLRSGRTKAPPLGDMVAALAEGMSESIKLLAERVADLERQAAGMQKTVDHLDAHALVFMGDWQASLSYEPGHVVRHQGKVYTALRSVLPAKGEPNRSGSGWTEIV